MNLDRWIRQPTTMHGLAVLAAGAGAALAHVAAGDPKIDAAVAVVAYVLIHLGINDNSAPEQAMAAFVTDLTHGAPVSQMLADAAGAAAALPVPAAGHPAV